MTDNEKIIDVTDMQKSSGPDKAEGFMTGDMKLVEREAVSKDAVASVRQMGKEAKNIVRRFKYKTQEVPLPSKGILYPENHPLRQNGGTVIIRQLTAADEDVIMDRQLIKKGTFLDVLINRCVIEPKNLDSTSMFIGDRNTILTALRISGLGPEYPVQLECPECNTKFDETYILNKIILKSVNEDGTAEEVGINRFKIKLNDMGVDCVIKILTAKEEREIQDQLDTLKRKNITASANITRLMKIVVSIDGNENTAYLRELFENEVPMGDSKQIKQAYNDIAPEMIMKENGIMCPECFYEFDAEIPIAAGFFWPELTRRS
jgi:hypothetical protein